MCIYISFVYNSGTFNIDYDIASGGRLFQVISGPDEIVPIDVSGAFDIVVDAKYVLSMADLMDAARFADRLILDNTILVLDINDKPMARIRDVPIMLLGNVSVSLPSVDVLKFGPVLRNIDGDGSVTIFAPDVDELYAIQSYILDGDVYGRIVRETDYAKIFKNDVGMFLNALRKIMPDDKLLGAMDIATTMDDLNSIMHHSVRIRPINLMRPLRTMRKYSSLDLTNSAMSSVDASTFLLLSNKFNLYRIDTGLSIAANDKINANLAVYTATGIVNDDINEYEINTYGVRMYVGYDNGRFVFGGDIDTAFTKFDVGPVFINGAVGYDPYGISFYSGLRTGYRFNVTRAISIMPFVGLDADFVSVADTNKFDGEINAGAELAIHDNCIGIEYDYILRAVVDSSGTVGAVMHLGFDFASDSYGLDFNAGVIRDDYATAFRAFVGMRFKF